MEEESLRLPPTEKERLEAMGVAELEAHIRGLRAQIAAAEAMIAARGRHAAAISSVFGPKG